MTLSTPAGLRAVEISASHSNGSPLGQTVCDLLLRAAVRRGRHRGGGHRRGLESAGGLSLFGRVVPGDRAGLRQLRRAPGHFGRDERRRSPLAHRRARRYSPPAAVVWPGDAGGAGLAADRWLGHPKRAARRAKWVLGPELTTTRAGRGRR